MTVTCSDITPNYCRLSIYHRDKYLSLDMSDVHSTSDYCSSAASSICSQDSWNQESTDDGSLFSLLQMIAGFLEECIIPATPKMRFPMEVLGNCSRGSKTILELSSYIE